MTKRTSWRHLLMWLNSVAFLVWWSIWENSLPTCPKSKATCRLTKSEWVWGDIQRTAFLQIKHELSDCPIVAVYDPSRDTRVSTYVSSYGLGAVLTQQQEDQQWKPVAYTSRVLTPTKERHTKIEEVLGIIWACKWFSEYLVSMQFQVDTDHNLWFPCLVRRI